MFPCAHRPLAVASAAALFAFAGFAAPIAVAQDAANSAAHQGGESPAPGSYAVVNGDRVPIPSVPMGDPDVVKRIVAMGKNHNQVMDHLTYLTTKIGPRLTGSSNAEAANVWAKEQFEKWGLTNVELFKWGEIPVRFDRGPSTGKVVMARNTGGDAPEYRTLRELEFTTLAWGAGTNGAVRGPIVRMPTTEAEFEAVKDQLKGSWILIKSAGPAGRRGVGGFAGGMNARQRMFMDLRKKWKGGDAAQAEAAKPVDPNITRFEGTATGPRLPEDGVPVTLEVNLTDPSAVTGNFAYSRFQAAPIRNATFSKDTGELKFTWESPRGVSNYTLKIDGDKVKGSSPLPENGGEITVVASKADASKEPAKPAGPTLEERVLLAGPAGFISASTDDRVRTSSIGGWRTLDFDNLPQDVEVQVRSADYDFINSRIADGVPIEVEFDLPNKFVKGPIPVYNTIAEIRGTEKPDEVVIISAHMDSWNGPGSQGCTDNGTGSSVTLEAARLLAACNVKPKRTIRFVLWTGEEQGLLGSAGYVKSLSKDELAKISAVFVDDGGTNYQGGLNAIEEMIPYLAAATAPVNGIFYSETDKKALEANIKTQKRFQQEGASDNASFNRVGVPGFFWDETGRADYFFGWHTQNDKLNLAIPEYLMQSATNSAVVAYQLANAPDLLPRPAKAADDKPDTAAPARRGPNEAPGGSRSN